MDDSAHQCTASLIARAREGSGEELGVLLQQYRNYLYLIARTAPPAGQSARWFAG